MFAIRFNGFGFEQVFDVIVEAFLVLFSSLCLFLLEEGTSLSSTLMLTLRVTMRINIRRGICLWFAFYLPFPSTSLYRSPFISAPSLSKPHSISNLPTESKRILPLFAIKLVVPNKNFRVYMKLVPPTSIESAVPQTYRRIRCLAFAREISKLFIDATRRFVSVKTKSESRLHTNHDEH